MAGVDPNLDLINNGIQTIEFIQSNRDEIQKTYGRSSIGQPRTKERAAAWEAYLESKDGHPKGQRRGGESQTSDSESSSREGNSDLGSSLSQSSLSEINPRESTGSGNYKGGYDEDPAELHSGTRDDCRRESNRNGGGGTIIGEGTDSTQGGNSSHEIDDGDYDRICLLDQATEDHLAGKETPGKLEVREARPSDIAEILSEDSSRTHRRLRGIRSVSRESESEESDVSPVKKGIAGSIVSMSSKGKHTSGSGATQHALLSPSTPTNRSVSADDARESARTAREISIDDDLGVFSSFGGGSDISDKIDRMLENQNEILSKLQVLAEVSEEIKGIKKILTNHSLSLSTLEGYINDLMIVIPKSGISNSDGDDEKNPDLRMVVGRDKSRGVTEVSKRKRPKSTFGEEIGTGRTIDEEYLLDPLDFKKNNAANFVPDNTPVSMSIIASMVKKRVHDPDTRDELLMLVESNLGSIPMKDMYEQIRKHIDQMDS
ncbi:P protein [Mount Mabu Lophuromys virus 1]|uniref:Phosphoprotein n=1 Tax=Mount Mabu Lophuromys virus 1 TaxID=2116559 RepID=A0A2P1GJ81_9MONO|nr:P protein [Mount Mabu Lophuromys virus 1]AVM86013.1 P protein [Mount Mabu Lophuromys virus 1]